MSPSIPLTPLVTCRHCKRPITRWDKASLAYGREVYTHDDFLDVDCNGVACRESEIEGEFWDQEAEPV